MDASAPDPLYVALVRPLAFDARGSLARATDDDAIDVAINELLTTVPGERPMRPEWGSQLKSRLFEPNDEVLKSLLRDDTETALRRWEPRVTVLRVDVAIGAPRTVTVAVVYQRRGARPVVEQTTQVTFQRGA
jgi:hypothetical protein